jgi:hypothetical protein
LVELKALIFMLLFLALFSVPGKMRRHLHSTTNYSCETMHADVAVLLQL